MLLFAAPAPAVAAPPPKAPPALPTGPGVRATTVVAGWSLDQFNVEQDEFKQALAQAAAVPADSVYIESVKALSRRRVLLQAAGPRLQVCQARAVSWIMLDICDRICGTKHRRTVSIPLWVFHVTRDIIYQHR